MATFRQGMLLLVALGAALVLVAPGALAYGRQDTALVSDRDSLDYAVVRSYNGNEAQNERRVADTNSNNYVTQAEADAYYANLVASSVGNQTGTLRWDNTATFWTSMNVTSTGLANHNTDKTQLSVTLTGSVRLASLAGQNHTLTLVPPSGSSLDFSVSVPSNWSIVGISGANVTSNSSSVVSGNVGAGGLALIQIVEALLFEDDTPPTVDAGGDRTVLAGAPAGFYGAAVDDDDAFPFGASFWWTFLYNGTPANLSGRDISFTFWTLGTYTLTFTAVDRSGNRASTAITVTVVSPDTEPPTLDPPSELTVTWGVPLTIHGNATDNDPQFPVGAEYLWTFVYNATALNIPSPTLAFTFWSVGTYELTFSVTDFWGNTNSTGIRLVVERPDKQAPVIELGQARSVVAGIPATFAAQVTDNDPAFPVGATFYWTFVYDTLPVNLSGVSAGFNFMELGEYSLTFTAIDFWGNRADATLLVTVTSPDTLPPSIDAGTDSESVAGNTVAFNAFANDNFPLSTDAVYYWTFEYRDQPVNLSGRDVAFKFEDPGTYIVQLEVRDAWGNAAFDARTVTVNAAAPGGGAGNSATTGLGSLFLPLAILGLAGASAIGLAAYRRRAREETEAETASLEAARTEAASAFLASTPGPTHVVEGLLILYKDGRLIHHQSAGSAAAFESPEVLGSMFTAVTEFIRDSFGQEGALSRLTYGQNTIILDRSAHLFGAVIVYGEPDNELRENLKEVLQRMESAYAGVVERWYGDRDAFPRIETFAATLFAATAGLTRSEIRAASGEKTVRLVSGTEHYKGYVRLRVAIANQTEEKLSDATITVVFNQNVLRLARIEPAGLENQGLTVKLGDVAAGERVGAIYYLDPQNCSRTNIEGIATYKDAKGEARTVSMKPRTEEVVCPLFFTPHHASPGMMKRLIETSLAARDSKLYRILSLPAGAGYKDVFGIVREAVQRHHVVLVRNIATRSPFEGKAWFYGQTKHSKSPVIIRGTVSEERRAVEIFVAVDSPATLTGLLAEFHRTFTEMMRERLPEAKLEPILEDRLKGLLSSDEFSAAGNDDPAP